MGKKKMFKNAQKLTKSFKGFTKMRSFLTEMNKKWHVLGSFEF
jgi:hypothetical protein